MINRKYSLYYEGLKAIRNSDFYNHQVDKVDGRTLYINNKKVTDFSTCAYLGLEKDIQSSDVEKAKLYGLRDGWSRITGTSSIVRGLEKTIAQKLNFQACRLGQSISLINGSVFYSLKELFDYVLCDTDAHFTLKKGIETSFKLRKKLLFFKNNDLNFLENKLKKINCEGSKLIVVDGIYSMKGSFAKVNEILNLCEKYNAYLYIDDAHGFGSVGSKGLGVLDELHIKNKERIIYVAGFSKSCSNPVAFLASNEKIINCLDNSAPFLSFSGPPSNLHCAISERHLSLFESDSYGEKRNKLKEYSLFLHEKCREIGLETLSSQSSPILAIKINSKSFGRIAKKIFDMGFIAKSVIYPAVRKGDEVIRFTVTASHKKTEVNKLLDVMNLIKEFDND